MQPIEIIEIDERPFFHFKTNRIGLTKELLTKRFQQSYNKKTQQEARA